MFGYIKPNKSELKVREMARYNAYYCGLCKRIGKRFGQLPRSLLNYDCTFAALLLSGFKATPCCSSGKCIYKPLKARHPIITEDSEALRFAADLNVLLAFNKLKDDMSDERKPISYAGYAVFLSAYNRAKRYRPELDLVVSRGIKSLSELEKNDCKEIDAVANSFADMMREIFACAPLENESERTPLLLLAFNLGRWIYLIDAFDDRAKDKKRGSYNPFNAGNIGLERAKYLLNQSLNEAVLAYDILNITSDKSILDNIMYDGCFTVTQNLLRSANESL
ncbi:MAG: DUF5685 family protein [Clostridia bacterium]